VDGVTVWLAGAFAMTGGGAPDRAPVGSRKARLLLALLAVFRGRVVPTDRIVDVLWPGQTPPTTSGRGWPPPARPATAATMTTPEPTNSPAPITPPMAIILS
jgi:hypothetical protein